MEADRPSSRSMDRTEARRFGLFIIAGGLAAAANYGSRFGFSLWFSYPVAIVCAYLIGMAVAFVLMRQYVFEGGGKALGPQVVMFGLVNLLAVLQTLVVSLVLARWFLPSVGVTAHVEAIAHAFGVAVPLVTSYIGHKRATFR
jgi:putative flippase GtrA